MTQKAILEQLFHHDQQARQLEEELLSSADREGLIEILGAATDKAGEGEDAVSTAQLELLSGLWSQVGGEQALTRLLQLLGHPDEMVRGSASSGLASLAENDFNLFRDATLRFLDTDEAAMAAEDLAFLLTEVDHEGVIELLLAMLDHGDARVTVAALEVAGEFSWDTRVTKKLSTLQRDKRSVTFEDEEEGEVSMTIGELVEEVLETLRMLDEDKVK